MKFLLFLALAGHAAPPTPAPATATTSTTTTTSTFYEVQVAWCKGCGCRGGPGWRIHRTGQCAGKANLAKECGRPPSPARCTKEN